MQPSQAQFYREPAPTGKGSAMRCPRCGEEARRSGYTSTGRQRFYCQECDRKFCFARHQPLGAMRLPMEKAVPVLRLLLEGNSIRATERLTGVNRNTVMALVLQDR